MNKQDVLKLIEASEENAVCDFKECYYHKEKKSDLIKDILSFCNGTATGDKYIIFNIIDSSHEIGNMNIDTVPDISEIDNLLREYCEPHINIALHTFKHKSKDIAYIQILANNLNRPYMVKKSYERNGKTLLHQGQIFIRRGSSNFTATRSDLEEIIESRINRSISIKTDQIQTIPVVEDNRNTQFFSCNFLFRNDSAQNFIIKEAEISLKTTKHSICATATYIDTFNKTNFSKSTSLSFKPLDVPPHYTIQNTIYFTLSDSVYQHFKDCSLQNNPMTILIHLTDANGITISSDTHFCTIL